MNPALDILPVVLLLSLQTPDPLDHRLVGGMDHLPVQLILQPEGGRKQLPQELSLVQMFQQFLNL